MKMKKKILVAVLVLAVTMVMFGCAPSETTPTAPATQEPSTTNQTTATPQPSVEPTPSEKAEVLKAGETYRYYLWSVKDPDNPFSGAANEAQATDKWHDYEDKYGITIQFIKAEGGAWENLPRETAFAGDPCADILCVGGPYVVIGTVFYQGVEGACLEALNPYFDVADFSDPEYWDQGSQEACTFNGKMYCAVPNATGSEVVLSNHVTLFNAKLLEKAGYSKEAIYALSDAGEWTWEKFKEVAINCTDLDNGVYGTALGDNNVLVTGLIVSNGGSYFQKQDVNGVMKDRFVGNSQRNLEAWDYILDLNNAGVIDTSGMVQSNSFGTQKVAMLITNLSAITVIYKFLKFDYGVVQVPKGPSSDTYVSNNDWFVPYGVLKGAYNPAGCAKIISEYMCPECAKSSKENEDLMKADLGIYLKDQKSIDNAMLLREYNSPQNYYLYQQVDCDGLKMLYYMYGAVFDFITGEQTPSTFFASVTDAVNNALDNIG